MLKKNLDYFIIVFFIFSLLISVSFVLGNNEQHEQELIDFQNYIEFVATTDPMRYYYTKEEIGFLQLTLNESIFSDGIISEIEIRALQNLHNFDSRCNIQWDIIRSKMINEKYLSADWDQDGISNINEIINGTNPLNDLETSSENLSYRYAIVINHDTVVQDGNPNNQDFMKCVFNSYHLLKKNGYDDSKIILIVYDPLNSTGLESFSSLDPYLLNPFSDMDLLNDFGQVVIDVHINYAMSFIINPTVTIFMLYFFKA